MPVYSSPVYFQDFDLKKIYLKALLKRKLEIKSLSIVLQAT